MIAKGNPHNSGPYLARYLAAISKGDERAELEELRGFASDNIFEAFALGQLQASGTQCQKPFFHVQVRTPKGEDLNREQWRKVADRIERHLGFNGQPRAIVFHRKDGHEHMHLVWSRIGDDMRAIDPGLYKRKLKEICRKLEKEMGLQQVRNERDPHEPGGAGRGEYEQARRLKTDIKEIRASIRDCWDRSDNGRSFTAALEAQGLVLAQGDRRAFVVIDARGGYHALSKRITGATAKETLARLDGLDAAALPSVAAAQAMQLERQQGRKEDEKLMPDEQIIKDEEQKRKAIAEDEERRLKEIGAEEERKKEAIKTEEERKQQAIREDEEKKTAAIQEEQRKEAARREEERRAEAKEQADRQAEQAQEMERLERVREAYKAQLTRMAEEAKRQEDARRQTGRDGKALEGDIRNPHYRYGQALAQHYDMGNPYGSLARAAMGEYGAFLRDREHLDRDIARAKTPEARQALELRREIEFKEYMAITSDRIAAQSEIIVGRRNTDEAVKQRERAETFRNEAKDLRKEYAELQLARRSGKGDGKSQTEARSGKAQEDIFHQFSGPESFPPPGASKETGPGLMVQDKTPGKPRGTPEPLGSFLQKMPAKEETPVRAYTATELRNDPAAKKAHYRQLFEEEQRGKAFEHIARDLKTGRPLNADDVRKLKNDDLEKIKSQGDDYLRQITREMERHRGQERER